MRVRGCKVYTKSLFVTVCYNLRLYIFIPVLALVFNSCTNTSQQEKAPTSTSGKVVSISDGDTYQILLAGNKKVKVRMAGIDAPERGMPYYKVSKEYLKGLCLKKNVRLELSGEDMHGRTLAFSYLDDGTELSHEMVKAGLAWHYKEYSTDAGLAKLEVEARIAKRGLWVDNTPEPPWEHRRNKRKGVADTLEVAGE